MQQPRHFAFWPPRRPKVFPVPVTSIAHNLATSAARYPDHHAIVFYDTPITYRRLWAEVEQLAGYLEHRAGVRRGDRVLLYMQNSPQFVISYYAILRANAVIVPLSPMLVAEELGVYLDDCGAHVAITGQELLPKLRGMRRIRYITSSSARMPTISSMRRRSTCRRPSPRRGPR